jgi:hypothetical protein
MTPACSALSFLGMGETLSAFTTAKHLGNLKRLVRRYEEFVL